jgi:DNA-binding transcriptional ArsR family regulator
MIDGLAFAALADPTRRTVFERLSSGQKPVSQIAQCLAVSRTAVSLHVSVEGGRVASDRVAGCSHARVPNPAA